LSGLPSSGTWTLTSTPGSLTKSGTGTSTTFTGLSANTTYTFTVTNAAGCTSSASGNVVINNSATPSAPVLGTITQPTCLVSTGSVSFTGLPSSGTWTVTSAPLGRTITGSGTTGTMSNLPPNTYTFRVTNSAGCTSPASASAKLNSSPTAPQAFNLTGSSFCSNAPGTGTVQLSSSENSVSYQLRLGTTNVQGPKNGNGSSITWTNLAAGIGYNVVASRSGCTSQTNSVNVTSITAPSAGITYTGSPYCRSLFGVATVTQTGQTGGTYSSTPGGLMMSSTTGAISLMFSNPGNYTVRYTVSSGGCTTVATTTVRINNCGRTITTQTNPVTNPKIAKASQQQLTINVRPVPTQTNFTLTVKTGTEEPVLINIYDVTGRKIQQLRGGVLDSYQFGDNYAQGAYLVEVLQGSQRVTQKVLKQ